MEERKKINKYKVIKIKNFFKLKSNKKRKKRAIKPKCKSTNDNKC